MKNFIEVGYIVKAHGIRGEICIDYNADSPDLLYDSVYLSPQSDIKGGAALKRHALKSLRMHHGRPLLVLEGVPDRTAAELLRGYKVFIPEERLPELDDDEIYMHDLVGLEVLAREGEAEPKSLGTLARAEEHAGQELWTILTPAGQEILFPVAEDFVESIDLDANQTVITPPPGLLEIYLEAEAPKKEKAPRPKPGSGHRNQRPGKKESRQHSAAGDVHADSRGQQARKGEQPAKSGAKSDRRSASAAEIKRTSSDGKR